MKESSQTIGLIDDDLNSLETIKLFLDAELDTVTVHAFPRSINFITSLQKHSYDLVITDLEMPSIDGIEIIHQLNIYSPKTPIIVLSGNTELVKTIPERSPQVFEVFIKPVEADKLVRSVRDGLACSGFINPPVKRKNSLSDKTSEKRVIEEIIHIHHEVKKILLSGSKDTKRASQLLGSQYKLLRILLDQAES